MSTCFKTKQDSGLPADPSLLFSDSTTAESLTNNNEAELQRRCEARQQEIDHMQQVLQTKIQLLQEVEAHLHKCTCTRLHTCAFVDDHTKDHNCDDDAMYGRRLS